ncbi:MAG TPA: PaaI family thioesterase [Acidimicrobiales bacterium]|nr:PaaI family thioesterase [Acidimicrobiales bacterium]
MSERAQEVRDLADAVRDLIHRMVATAAPVEVFAGVAASLREVAARFEPYPKEYLYHGVRESGLADAGSVGSDYEGPFDLSPVMGRANPLAPPLKLQVLDDRVAGSATFGPAYEGPPGCVHGGYIAAAFDEVLGLTQMLGGQPGMTGRLTVNYRTPTPLGEELRLEGWIDRVEGRKTFCRGEIRVGDRLCAECEGIFISVDFEKIKSLAEHAQRGLE